MSFAPGVYYLQHIICAHSSRAAFTSSATRIHWLLVCVVCEVLAVSRLSLVACFFRDIWALPRPWSGRRLQQLLAPAPQFSSFTSFGLPATSFFFFLTSPADAHPLWPALRLTTRLYSSHLNHARLNIPVEQLHPRLCFEWTQAQT